MKSINIFQKKKQYNLLYKFILPYSFQDVPHNKHITKKFKVEKKNNVTTVLTKGEDSDSDTDKTENISTKNVKKISNDVSDSDKSDSDTSYSRNAQTEHVLNAVSDSDNTDEEIKILTNIISKESTSLVQEEFNENDDIFDVISDSDLTKISKYKDYIRDNFLVDMPSNFFHFWDFCKKLNSSKPQEALKDIGLILVGPFDVLIGNIIIFLNFIYF